MELPDRDKCYRPLAFDKMEGLVREMQDAENGVPVRSQKLFLTSIPSAFMGYDLIEWLMERLGIEESEALNIANQLCQYGYFFPVSDSKNLVVKDDSSLYRFQTPYYWPWQHRTPDNVEYAIYLAKRTLRNKQRHGLEEYELEALNNLRKNLQNKWDFITLQAEEQVKLAKERKKGDKIVSDSQERAYWRVYRPPPGFVSSLEQCPVPNRNRNGSRQRRRTLEDCKREVELLRNSLTRTRVKVSQALENMVQYVETYSEYDPLITGTQPSNPWVSEDLTYWQLNSALVEIPTEKRVRRWGLSMEELVSDPTGLHEFTAYLRKEYSHENIRFWMAVNDLRRSSQSQIQRKVSEIFEEFLAPGAPCEINIDGKTMERVHQELKAPSRFTFDSAAEHVYTLLLKKDCYPRFIRSEHYKSLLASGIQPSHKKRFFGFGPTKKKTSTSTAPNPALLQQQPNAGSAVGCGALTRRRGSDRSLSGSAHELAISGVRDPSRVPHSHSQSNLSDIPYRETTAESSCGVCPWDEPTPYTNPAGTNPPGPLIVPTLGHIGNQGPNPGVAGIQATAQGTSQAIASCILQGSTQAIASSNIQGGGEQGLGSGNLQGVGQSRTNEGDSSARIKKPSIAVASTSDEQIICPWESTPPQESEKTLDVRSRKNSTQFDSGSSSSDISLAIAEVSDRLRRTCGITQQNTLDGDRKQRKLSTTSCVEQRRSSVSIPPIKLSERPIKTSFEETSTSSGSCILLVASDVLTLSEKDNNDDVVGSPSNNKSTKSLRKTSSICGGSNAPIISVSSVVDETITDPQDIFEGIKQEFQRNDIKEMEFPLAPLAVPDSESPGSDWVPEIPQEIPVDQDKTPEEGANVENKQNEICPWEDE